MNDSQQQSIAANPTYTPQQRNGMKSNHVQERVQEGLRPKLGARPHDEVRLQRGDIGSSEASDASNRADVRQRAAATPLVGEKAKQLAGCSAPFVRIREDRSHGRVEWLWRLNAIQVDDGGVATGAVRHIEKSHPPRIRQQDPQRDDRGRRDQKELEEETRPPFEKRSSLRIPLHG